MDGSVIFSLCLFLSLYITECLAVNCYNKTDGIYEMNCRAYTRCIEGYAEIITCEHGQAVNNNTGVCESKWDVPPPCGTYRECADKHNGFYADLETNCRSYYTCTNGMFIGHTLCPAALVFNKVKQVCDYTFSVAPPCGTNVKGTS